MAAPAPVTSSGKRLAAIAVLVVPVFPIFLFHPDLNRARRVGGVDEGSRPRNLSVMAHPVGERATALVPRPESA